jgi:hypothetical protein
MIGTGGSTRVWSVRAVITKLLSRRIGLSCCPYPVGGQGWRGACVVEFGSRICADLTFSTRFSILPIPVQRVTVAG